MTNVLSLLFCARDTKDDLIQDRAGLEALPAAERRLR